MSIGIGIAFVPDFFDDSQIPGIVSKELKNADGSAFTDVQINGCLAFKPERGVALNKALMNLIGEL